MDLIRQILHKSTCLSMDESSAAQLGELLGQVNDWQLLIRQAELYAVANLLLKHITEHSLNIDQANLLSLKALSMRHRAVANARYKVISEISEIFAANDIPFVALKGLALAPMIYPADELRPMRDMDFLVPLEQEQLAADLLRDIGFNLPSQQANKYMRGSHQLPNATKKVDGFTISVEVHHDAFSRDVVGHLRYQDVKADMQTVPWRELDLLTLGHSQMLHQVSRHLEGLHPGAVLKLINVLDVIAYCEAYIDEIDWQEIQSRYSHVINTLHCLHLVTPLSIALQDKIGGCTDAKPNGIGEIMQSLTAITSKRHSFKEQWRLLFMPSDWWLYLYYNRRPNKSLLLIKVWRHPMRVSTWFWQRLYSMLRGG